MIKSTLVFASLCLSVTAFGQITLYSSDFPNAGDSVLISLTSNIASQDPTLTGANYTWDYSALNADMQRFEKFDSPNTFTSPFNLLFNVLTTTYGHDNYTLTSIPVPSVTLDAAYDFFKKTSGYLRQHGAGYTINSIPLPFLYSASDTIYRFPVDYLDADSCNFKFALPASSALPIYYGQSGKRVNRVDGWGTITTPYGTFSALRLKSTIMAVDTVYIDTLGFGFSVNRSLQTEYKWLATGMKVPVLQVTTTDVAGIETITEIAYIDSVRAVPQVGIAENTSNTNLNVFPNPATDQVIVQYNLAADAKVKISVTNIVGQTIAVVADENAAAGNRSVVLNIKEHNMQPGIYFINVESAGFREVRKIVITK